MFHGNLDIFGILDNVWWHQGGHADRCGRRYFHDADRCRGIHDLAHDALTNHFKEVQEMAALFTAVDTSTLATNVSTLQIAFIGVGLLFMGFYYVKRTMHTGQRV